MRKLLMLGVFGLLALSLKFSEIANESTVDLDGVMLGYDNFHYIGKATRVLTESKDSESCIGWHLEQSDFNNLLEEMTRVEGVEWGAYCYNFPCYYIGKVSNKSETYKVEINAASFVILSNNKRMLYFISKGKLPYFLEACSCCEDE